MYTHILHAFTHDAQLYISCWNPTSETAVWLLEEVLNCCTLYSTVNETKHGGYIHSVLVMPTLLRNPYPYDTSVVFCCFCCQFTSSITEYNNALYVWCQMSRCTVGNTDRHCTATHGTIIMSLLCVCVCVSVCVRVYMCVCVCVYVCVCVHCI